MWKHGNKSNSVTGNTQDRQWDMRYNVQAEEDLDQFLGRVRAYAETGPLKYILIGGVEIGTKPNQGDYQILDNCGLSDRVVENGSDMDVSNLVVSLVRLRPDLDCHFQQPDH